MDQVKEQLKSSEGKTRVVVLGAGVAGLYVAQALKDAKNVHVTLVSPSDCFVFLPRLTELLANSIPSEKSCLPLANVWKGEIVNPAEKQVVVESGKTIAYDVLVVAIGSVVNFFNTPGSQYSYSFYSKADEERLQEHISSLLEADDTSGTRTFTVVGGGPTGCEVAYAISALLAAKKSQGKILILDRGPSVLAAFPQNLREAVSASLISRGITIIPDVSVVNVTPLTVDIARADGSKESIPCLTTVWAAGSKPQSLAITGVERTARGELPVKPTLQLESDPSIFVLGDCAAAGCPKTAQAAVQQAQLVSKNIPRFLAGKSLDPFAFKDKGVIIALEKDTVGLFMGTLLKGFIARQIRDKYYLMTLGKYK
jgi:NADH dehydrogenase FAD-containing subunit